MVATFGLGRVSGTNERDQTLSRGSRSLPTLQGRPLVWSPSRLH